MTRRLYPLEKALSSYPATSPRSRALKADAVPSSHGGDPLRRRLNPKTASFRLFYNEGIRSLSHGPPPPPGPAVWISGGNAHRRGDRRGAPRPGSNYLARFIRGRRRRPAFPDLCTEFVYERRGAPKSEEPQTPNHRFPRLTGESPFLLAVPGPQRPVPGPSPTAPSPGGPVSHCLPPSLPPGAPGGGAALAPTDPHRPAAAALGVVHRARPRPGSDPGPAATPPQALPPAPRPDGRVGRRENGGGSRGSASQSAPRRPLRPARGRG